MKKLFALASVTAIVIIAACSSHDGNDTDTEGVNCAVTSSGCTCQSFGTANDFSCAATGSDDVCCADTGWPDSGSCSCKKAPVECAVSGSECKCDSKTTFGTKGATCYPGGKTTAPTGTTTGNCCLDTKAGTCTCNSYKASCSGTEVTSCTAAQVSPTCSTGTKVTSCSDGTSGSGSGSGSGSASTSASTGSGTPKTCSPTSGDCDGSGDCSCGQGCFATAVCSTCTKRCGYSCVTDQDCLSLKMEHNLSVGYTHCVKTSPNFDIYKCE